MFLDLNIVSRLTTKRAFCDLDKKEKEHFLRKDF